MKFSLLLITTTFAILTNGQNADNIKLHFNGFYQTKAYIDKVNNDTTYGYLRFYANGKVISVTSQGEALDLKEWFNLKMGNPSVGEYRIHEKRLKFSTTSNQGTVVYKGKIKSASTLILKSKSKINGYIHKEKYNFVLVSDLG